MSISCVHWMELSNQLHTLSHTPRRGPLPVLFHTQLHTPSAPRWCVPGDSDQSGRRLPIAHQPPEFFRINTAESLACCLRSTPYSIRRTF